MSTRIVVDPVTRIEGHLRIEAEIENGIIQDAFSSGTMVRGIEIIVQDRDPREVWAYVGRVCGVCTSIHSLCSVRAVENALGIVIPPNAEMVRNLMQGALLMHDHVVHFYQLQALDWVDVISALKADPRKASETAQSLSDWPKSSPGYFRDIQQKIKKVRQRRTIRNFQQRILGTSSLQVTSRSQSHRSCTLPRSTGSTERHRKNPNDFRREKSSPQLPRRRYGLRRKHQRPECPEPRTTELCRRNHRRKPEFHSSGISARCHRHRFVLPGMDSHRRRIAQLYLIRRLPDGTIRRNKHIQKSERHYHRPGFVARRGVRPLCKRRIARIRQ